MTREELTARVIAAPDDDAPRLVLADWFAERGDARGELIHVGCALADGSVDPGQREACERRYAELIAGPGTAWLTELGLKSEVAGFHRGMVEAVSLPWGHFHPVADRLFASTPLRALTTWELGKKGLRLWPLMPWLGRLETLHLRGVDARQLEVLLGAAGLSKVRRLVIEGSYLGRLDLSGALALGAWPSLPQVLELGLINTGMDERGLSALAGQLLQLTALDLTIAECGVDGVRTILSHTARLQTLALGSNPVGDAGALLLAGSLALSLLESLRLESARIGDAGALALLRSSLLPRLRRLDLAGNRLTDGGAVALAEVAKEGLAALNVTGNAIGDRGDRALRGCYGSRVRV